MLEGKTTSGFDFSVDENALDDMEIVELIAAVDAGDITKTPALITKVLGDDQKKRLYDHIRENGRVPVKKAHAEIIEVFNALGAAGKKS